MKRQSAKKGDSSAEKIVKGAVNKYIEYEGIFDRIFSGVSSGRHHPDSDLIPEEDFEKMSVNPHRPYSESICDTKGRYPAFSNIFRLQSKGDTDQDYLWRVKDRDYYARYILYMYAPDSPLIKAITDVRKRKEHALLLCGVDKLIRSNQEVNDIWGKNVISEYLDLEGMDSKRVEKKFIVLQAFLKSQYDLKFTTMVAQEELLYKINRELMSEIDEVEGQKKAATLKIRVDLAIKSEELLKQIYSALEGIFGVDEKVRSQYMKLRKNTEEKVETIIGLESFAE